MRDPEQQPARDQQPTDPGQLLQYCQHGRRALDRAGVDGGWDVHHRRERQRPGRRREPVREELERQEIPGEEPADPPHDHRVQASDLDQPERRHPDEELHAEQHQEAQRRAHHEQSQRQTRYRRRHHPQRGEQRELRRHVEQQRVQRRPQADRQDHPLEIDRTEQVNRDLAAPHLRLDDRPRPDRELKSDQRLGNNDIGQQLRPVIAGHRTPVRIQRPPDADVDIHKQQVDHQFRPELKLVGDRPLEAPEGKAEVSHGRFAPMPDAKCQMSNRKGSSGPPFDN